MIEDHKHCVVCGKPTEVTKTVCSPSCEEILRRQQKRMARSRMMMLIFFVVMILLIMVIPYLTGAGQ